VSPNRYGTSGCWPFGLAQSPYRSPQMSRWFCPSPRCADVQVVLPLGSSARTTDSVSRKTCQAGGGTGDACARRAGAVCGHGQGGVRQQPNRRPPVGAKQRCGKLFSRKRDCAVAQACCCRWPLRSAEERPTARGEVCAAPLACAACRRLPRVSAAADSSPPSCAWPCAGHSCDRLAGVCVARGHARRRTG